MKKLWVWAGQGITAPFVVSKAWALQVSVRLQQHNVQDDRAYLPG